MRTEALELLATKPFPSKELDWWMAINITGVVVILAVVALLSLLVALVATIDRNVTAIGYTLTAITENTQHTPLITETAAAVDAVLAEGLNHHLFLTRVTMSVEHPVTSG
jgi:hypothetical protein